MIADVDDLDTSQWATPHGPPELCPPRYRRPPGRERWNARYLCPREIRYWSPRYRRWITVARAYPSAGATGARDIDSRAWWVHDRLCDWPEFDDGSPCTNWQASMILGDILAEDGHWFRRVTWPAATWLFGGGRCREVGMWRQRPLHPPK